jgi:hypothetical protein
MNKENTKKLLKRFEFFHPKKPLTESLMAFGFECGDGWFDLIWELCEKIEKELDKHPELKGVKLTWYEKIWAVIQSVFFTIKLRITDVINTIKGKEKKYPFLDRRISFKDRIPTWKYHPFEVLQVKEKFGTLRFYTNFETKEISNYIEEAEKKSAHTCEVCGEEGKLRTGGWLMTLCDEHVKKE